MDIAINIAIFIAGTAFGIAWNRFLIMQILHREPWTTCDYCEYKRKKEELFPKRK